METHDSTSTTSQDASTPTQTGAANPGSTEARFTQADVERILSEKLEKAPQREARVRAQLLEQLGLTDADFESAKSAIAEARKRKEDEMSAVEKAQAAIDKANRERDDALARLTQRETAFRQRELARAVEKAATAAKANDAETVYLYLKEKHGEALNAVMGEDGEVDTKTLDALLEKVKQEKAVYFIAPTQALGSISNLGGRPALSSTTEAMKRASAMNQRIIRGR